MGRNACVSRGDQFSRRTGAWRKSLHACLAEATSPKNELVLDQEVENLQQYHAKNYL
ncbi:MAG: hypothetical protein ACFFCZ_10290 [Promethearchaeota archaeon]